MIIVTYFLSTFIKDFQCAWFTLSECWLYKKDAHKEERAKGIQHCKCYLSAASKVHLKKGDVYRHLYYINKNKNRVSFRNKYYII